jgi:DNA-binding beta-propeller fold protein YncE
VAVSGDGKSLYAASFEDDAIARFNRNTISGALTFAQCFDDEDTDPEGAKCTNAPGLDGAQGVTVSEDARSLYAASGFDDAIARFDRNPTTGALTFAQCIEDEDSNLEGASCTNAPGIEGAVSVAASGDGRSLYAASAADDAIVRFDREPLSPPPPPQPPPPPAGAPPSNEFSFGKLKRNKKKGTAKLTVTVPGPGGLELAKNSKVKGAEKRADAAGDVKLSVKPKRKAKQKLAEDGRAKVRAEVTYTPDGGDPNTQSKRVKLVKR